ncbi:unnamed protein product [Pedinophyceae sp. YPF-701]|nr:unnamed protein product [Pedinophyceae sp. YPF-701]
MRRAAGFYHSLVKGSAREVRGTCEGARTPRQGTLASRACALYPRSSREVAVVATGVTVGVILTLVLMSGTARLRDSARFIAPRSADAHIEPLPVTAACISGLTSSFIMRGVYRNLKENLLDPFEADTFVRINPDHRLQARDLELRIKDLQMAMDEIEPVRAWIGVQDQYKIEDCGPPPEPWPDLGWHCFCKLSYRENERSQYVSLGRHHYQSIQFLHIHDCGTMIREHEREARGDVMYSYVFRLRTDIKVNAFDPPSLYDRVEQLRRKGHAEACLAPTRGMSIEFGAGDHFGFCSRGAAEGLFEFSSYIMSDKVFSERLGDIDDWTCVQGISRPPQDAARSLADAEVAVRAFLHDSCITLLGSTPPWKALARTSTAYSRLHLSAAPFSRLIEPLEKMRGAHRRLPWRCAAAPSTCTHTT